MTIERLLASSPDAVDEINVLLRQLKPAWRAVGLVDLEEVLASPTRVYVARAGEPIVGLALMVPHRHFGGLRFHVEDVVVDEGHRRRGIATRLLEAAIADAPAETASFDLRSHRVRAAAHGLYDRLGFVPSDTTVFRRMGSAAGRRTS